MTPGLAGGPPFPRAAKKGALVAIASTEAPSVPVAVGTCEIDVSALGRVQGSKGHAVRILHWAGDELWAWSASGKPGGAPPASVEGWLGGRDGEAEVRNGGTGLGGDGLANGMAELGVGDGDDGEGDDDGGGGVPVDGGMVGEDGANAGKKKAAELESEEDEVDPPVQEKELSTKGESSLYFLTRLLQEGTNISDQKSTMRFTMHSYTVSTTTKTPTRPLQTTDCSSHSHNPSSSRTSSYPSYPHSHPPRPTRYRSKRQAGRM